MNVEELRTRIIESPIYASDGNHSLRLWRVAENIQQHAEQCPTDDRMLHLMSRVGVLCRGLARDLREGRVTAHDVATILEQAADIGELSFEEWLGNK